MIVLVMPLARQEKKPAGWTPELAMKVNNVGAVRISSDARKAVYTVSQAVMTPEKSEYVTQVIQMGVAEPERLEVMGGSYGGFMTSWIVTQTRRFKAASVGAGVTNLMSFKYWHEKRDLTT